MHAHFTSFVLENGTLPIATSIQRRLKLTPGDQVRIQITVLNRPSHVRRAASRYDELLLEKDERILTPQERAELITLANAEFDAALVEAKKLVQKKHPELFDEHGDLRRRKALASLGSSPQQNKTPVSKRRAQR